MVAKVDQQLLINILAQMPPFNSVPKGDLKPILADLEVITLASGGAYHLNQKAKISYVLPFRGRLVLLKECKNHPYPICIWLAVGGLWSVLRADTPTISVSVESMGAG